MIENELRNYYTEIPDDLPAERRLRQLIEQVATPDAHPKDVASLRRWLTPVAAAAAVVLLVSGTAFGLSRWTATPSSRNVVSTPNAGGLAHTPAAATALLTPQVVVQILIDLLPTSGTESGFSGTASPGLVSGQLAYAKGAVTADLRVDVSAPDNHSGRISVAYCNSRDVSNSRGTITKRNDGSTLVVIAGTAPLPQVFLCRPDGISVFITETPHLPGTASTAPVSVNELAAIVTSDRWQIRVPTTTVESAAHLFVPSTQPAEEGPAPAPTK